MRLFVAALMLLALSIAVVKGQGSSEILLATLKSVRLPLVSNGHLTGSSISLQELIDKHPRIILNFVSARCEHSRQQLDSISGVLQGKIKDRNHGAKSAPIAVVFVDKSLARIHRALKKIPPTVLVVWDKGGELSKLLKVKLTPTVVVLDRDAKLKGIYEGFFAPTEAYRDFFAKLVEAVIRGSRLPPRPVHLQLSSGEGNCIPAG